MATRGGESPRLGEHGNHHQPGRHSPCRAPSSTLGVGCPRAGRRRAVITHLHRRHAALPVGLSSTRPLGERRWQPTTPTHERVLVHVELGVVSARVVEVVHRRGERGAGRRQGAQVDRQGVHRGALSRHGRRPGNARGLLHGARKARPLCFQKTSSCIKMPTDEETKEVSPRIFVVLVFLRSKPLLARRSHPRLRPAGRMTR